MPVITLPDGSHRQFAEAVTVQQVAESIGSGLAKAALAGKVDGRLVDTSYLITDDASLAIVTSKDPEGVDVIRHSTAHLLAQAVKQLFPTAQVTIGPVIENGFYYDFAFERSFTLDDLAEIEKKMEALVAAQIPVSRIEMTREAAIEYFMSIGEDYKARIIADIPQNEQLSLYKQGDFTDLCRGPHVPNTNKLKAFKLTKVAGAYWRGDANNEMLQRIYGTAWADKKALDDYMYRLEEAQKRDHRKIGKTLDLFHHQEEAPGMVFWHPKGWAIWQTVEQFIRRYTELSGYQEIKTPQLVDKVLWVKSGHWEKFRDDMFVTETEDRMYCIKPMSCPCHVQVFNQGLKSYRDLPIRYAEFGCCHRSEPSGTLHGLMRVRGFTQDDGHIFCMESQLQEEALRFIDQVYSIYKGFGFDKIQLKISTRPEKRVGSDEIWDKAERCLIDAVEARSMPYTLNPGEVAFYGPKIEFSLQDCLDRVWQCGTLQVDFSMPERLGAHYIAEDGSKQTPVMLHRAVLGSMERFLGILIEHHAGVFPTWLAPVQVALINITDKQADYVKQLEERLIAKGLRVVSDLRNEKMNLKIREHTLQKIPYLLIAGDREMQGGQIAVRTREGKDCGVMTVDAFIDAIRTEIDSHGEKMVL